MNFQYRRSESGSIPILVDYTSCPSHVYLRKDIEEIKRTREEGREETIYQYQEACVPKDEFIQYQLEKQDNQEQVLNFLLEKALSAEATKGGDNDNEW